MAEFKETEMKLDVGQVIDGGGWTPYQKLLVAGTALTIIVDGVDNQLLGNVIPSLMEEWTLPRGAFSTALAMSPLGMLIGGAVGGLLGDRIGRRTALLLSVFAFAMMTALTSTASNVTMLGALRFLAGLGLGGAMPNAAALASEYVPRRQRPLAVTLTIVCIPLGGMLAAFAAARVIPAFGWHALFLGGGLIPLVLAAILVFVLPESPRYLAGRPRRWPELIALLKRFGHPVPRETTFVHAATGQSGKPQLHLRALFSADLRRDTLALFGSFFFCLLANYLVFLLLVPTLTGARFSKSAANDLLGWWNIGGVGGALLGALFIQRFGSKATMLGLTLVTIAGAASLAAKPLDPENTRNLLLMCIVTAAALNGVQTAMYALAAHVYPTSIRGTGLGTSVAVGRIGNILAPYVGNLSLDHGGAQSYFLTIALASMAVFLALVMVRNHIPRSVKEPGVPVLAAPAEE